MRILTFDIEDWFHLLDHPATRTESQWRNFPSRFEANLERVLSIVESADVNATFFCLGWIAKEYPNLIRKIADTGAEIACHSSRHQLAYSQTPEQFKEDLNTAKGEIGFATGIDVDTYRIPGFSLTDENIWVFDILAEMGISVDCSVFPAARGHGGLPQFTSDKPCIVKTGNGNILKELPLNTQSVMGRNFVFSGGGYFRLFPYPVLKSLFSHNDYVMTYFHPRDFDPDQPLIADLSYLRRFKSYYGLKHAEKKLVRLLNEFDVMDVRTAVGEINWTTAPVVNV